MFRKSIFRMMLALCFFGFIATIAAVSRPVLAQSSPCDSVTDEQLVAEITAAIKADKKLAPQMPHINVASVYRAVKLHGWTDTKEDYDKVYEIVATTKCVKLINVNLFEKTPPPANSPLRPQPGGCGPGMKACGDICIPDNEICSITGKSANDE